MTALTTVTRLWPQPSGWRARCTYTSGCDWTARGHSRDDVLSQYLAHAELEHADIEPEGAA